MKIDLPFGEKKLSLKVPDNWEIVIPDTQKIGAQTGDEVSVIKRSMANPFEQIPIGQKDLKDKKVLIVVDDNTRPTPVYKFFHLVIDELKKAGAKEKNITLIPGLGIHTKMSQMEMEEKIGTENLKYIRWKNHDAYDKDQNISIGRTSLGLDIELNRELLLSDFIVLIGMIEPHLWAGYGGGMKLIFPGLGSAKSISEHHMLIARPPYEVNRVGYEPHRNSFRLQLEEVYNLLKKDIFMVNVLLDGENRIIDCVSGHPISAHREGICICKKISGLNVPKKADGIIVSSHPMDINLKQGMKGVANTLPAVKKNGIIMGFLAAKKGIDDITLPNRSLPLPFLRLLLKVLGKKRIWKFVELISANKNPEEKFLTYYTVNLVADYRLYVHAPTISRDETKKLGIFENFYAPQQVIEKGSKKLGKRPLVYVFKEAGSTFPLI